MSELKLISSQKHPLKSLVKGALENESRLLKAGMHQTENKLKEFEKKYNLSTQEFITQYENDELEENLDFDEWIGEHRLLGRLREKAETLKDIKIAN